MRRYQPAYGSLIDRRHRRPAPDPTAINGRARPAIPSGFAMEGFGNDSDEKLIQEFGNACIASEFSLLTNLV
jgi:hypothetical protein